MTFQNMWDLIVRVDDVVIDAGQPDLILVFEESNAHAFFEKPAEIFRLQHGDIGDFFDYEADDHADVE